VDFEDLIDNGITIPAEDKSKSSLNVSQTRNLSQKKNKIDLEVVVNDIVV